MLRLIFWPSILTLLVNIGRLAAEQRGLLPTNSGGSASVWGIVWLVFVFGA